MDSKIKVRAGVALVALALGTISISANAVLERVGPINPAPTHASLPAWYQDTSGLALEFCAPTNQAEVDALLCLIGPAEVPNFPEFFPGNFFDEHFWYAANANLTPANGGRILVVLMLEANATVPGDQVAFSRIRVRYDGVPLTGAYRFIHPYGDETFDGVAGSRIFVSDDVGIGVPGVFTDAMTSRLGPFLVPTATYGSSVELAPYSTPAVPGKLYIADPGRLGPVTGSQAKSVADPTLAPGTFIPRASTAPGATAEAPRSQNVFRVEGPAGSNIGGPGVDFIETTDFTLVGRIYTGVIPGRVDVSRASYTRNAAGQKLDVFATGSSTTQGRVPPQPRPLAVLPTLSFFDVPCASALDANGFPVPPYSAPTSANETSMLTANDGLYWAQIAPAVIPTAVCVKDGNAKDANGNVVPAYIPRNVADVVTITQAAYDPATQTLTVSASSSDETDPPVLTLAYGISGGGALTGGQVQVTGVVAPPDKARVSSSKFGVKDEQVSTSAGAAGPNRPPVALADTGTVVQGASVTIAVLGNDTDPDVGTTLSVTAVTAVTPSTAGTLTNNGIDVTFNSSANFSGLATFTYTISDGQGGTATAPVSVTVTPGANQPPVANADSATAIFNKAVTIPVLANDTDPNGDALGVVAWTNGTAGTVTTNGTTVTFTPTNGFSGPATFTYTVADVFGAQATGNVTVTVGPAPTLTVTLADFRAAGSEWRLAGTNATVGATVTVSLNGTNQVIGSAVVSAARTWTLRVRNSTIVPTAGSSISLQSTDGATASATVTLR